VDKGYRKEIAQINNNITTIVVLRRKKESTTGIFDQFQYNNRRYLYMSQGEILKTTGWYKKEELEQSGYQLRNTEPA
jgi:hypothetical protein